MDKFCERICGPRKMIRVNECSDDFNLLDGINLFDDEKERIMHLDVMRVWLMTLMNIDMTIDNFQFWFYFV